MSLPRGKVILEPYNPDWKTLFLQEKSVLQPIFGDHEVYHTGSTSIPGLSAKPIIDMLVGLDSLAEFERYRAKLESLGYVSMPEREKSWEIFIPKGTDDARSHYLHVLVDGSPEYERILLFRDYLIAYPLEATRYETLKRELADRYANDRSAYTASKASYIESVIEKAARWRREHA